MKTLAVVRVFNQQLFVGGLPGGKALAFGKAFETGSGGVGLEFHTCTGCNQAQRYGD